MSGAPAMVSRTSSRIRRGWFATTTRTGWVIICCSLFPSVPLEGTTIRECKRKEKVQKGLSAAYGIIGSKGPEIVLGLGCDAGVASTIFVKGFSGLKSRDTCIETPAGQLYICWRDR